MKKKLFLLDSLIITISLSLLFGLGIYFSQVSLIDQASNSLISLTEAYSFSIDKYEEFEVEDDHLRISIIDYLGDVIYDSELSLPLENHLDREEIKNAYEGNLNHVAIRESSSLGETSLYYAIKVDGEAYEGGYIYIRCSYTLSTVQSYFVSVLPWLILILVVTIALSILFIYFATKNSLEPFKAIGRNLKKIGAGEYNPEEIKTNDPEIEELAHEMDRISSRLNDSIIALNNERKRLDAIIDNISDGVVAFSKDKSILLINKKAIEIFEADSNYIDKNIIALNGGNFLEKRFNERNVFDFALNGRVYLCLFNTTNDIHLLVLTDVTSERQAAMTRKEFFDSASHELKTPLTSIRGFNELISISSHDEKIKEYSSRIDKESKRMLTLIMDMLTLEEIEKKTPNVTEAINLKEIGLEVVKELSPLAEEKKVKVDVQGEAMAMIEANDAHSIIKNLLENGIKYNHDGGHVKLMLSKNSLAVIDDGTGIPEKDQPYVFDRFYRVDKSRSRENGGTGLGLAIVKHLCSVYGFSIKLRSKLGLGSKIEISFNQN